jgi:hypothetical protein
MITSMNTIMSKCAGGTPKLKPQANVSRGFRASLSAMLNSAWKEQLPGRESYSSFTPIGLRKSLDAPSGCACVFSQTAESKAAARFICVQLLFPGSDNGRISRELAGMAG